MNTTSRTRRLRFLAGGVSLLVGLGGGLLAGRALGDDDTAAAGAPQPVAAPADTLPDGSAAPATGEQVYPAVEGTDIAAGDPLGNPAIDAGPLVANPSGAVDLTPDPEAGVTGTEPTPPAAPAEATDQPDADVRASVEATYEEAAAVAAQSSDDPPALPGAASPSVRAFRDPCVTQRTDGCATGVSATVLADRAMPAVQLRYMGWVSPASAYAAECRRQLPDANWRENSVFAVAINVPYEGVLEVGLHSAGNFMNESSQPLVLTMGGSVAPSDALFFSWHRAFEAGYSTPSVPLCYEVQRADMDRARNGCLAYWGIIGCKSRVDLTLSSLPDAREGQWSFPGWGVYDFEPQLSAQGNTGDFLRQTVRFEPIDERVVEVHVPLLAEAFGEPRAENGGNSARVAQLVTAVGYGGGVACQTQNPLGLHTHLAVTRQLYETRYLTPDPALPNQREAVITLLAPADMAQGEILNVCIYWHAFVNRSFDSPTVLAVEAHDLVPPSQAMTEIRISNASVLFDLTDVEFEVTGFRRLCGFGAGNGPDVQVLGDEHLVCVVRGITPREFDVSVYLGLTGLPGLTDRIVSDRHTVQIDNRGCTSRDCGPPRFVQFDLDEAGEWMQLSFTKVPVAIIPQLELGVVSDRYFPDRWVIDPSGFFTLPPPLVELPRAVNPQVDTSSIRVTPHPGQETTALDVSFVADRPVSVVVGYDTTYNPATAPCLSGAQLPNGVQDTWNVTVTGLCPGVAYRFHLTLTDEQGRTSTFRTDNGQYFYLRGSTEAPEVGAGFGVDYTLKVLSVGGATGVNGVLSAYSLSLDNGTAAVGGAPGLFGVDAPCTTLGSATPLAQGSRGGRGLVGDVLVRVNLSFRPGGLSCGAAYGTPITVSLQQFTRFDGTTPVTVQLTGDDGTVVEVTLTRSAD